MASCLSMASAWRRVPPHLPHANIALLPGGGIFCRAKQHSDASGEDVKAQQVLWEELRQKNHGHPWLTWDSSRAGRRRKSQLLLDLKSHPSSPELEDNLRAGKGRPLEKRLLSHFLKRCYKMEKLEQRHVRQTEAALMFNLPREELELRGIALFGLQLDTGHWRFREVGKLDIRLVLRKDMDQAVASRSFRVGKLVEVVLADDEKDDDGFDGTLKSVLRRPLSDRWRRVIGTISAVHESSIHVRVDTVSNFLAHSLTSPSSSTSRKKTFVYVTKKGEDDIFVRLLMNLERTLQRAEKKGPGQVARSALPKMYAGMQTDDFAKGSELPPPPTARPVIFNPNMDDSQRAAVENCVKSEERVTIIHGPPGTGKTTTLAAAVLAFLIENPSHRVLVSCPSHAACDAATLAILKHWPVSELGEPHKGNVIRLGSELRLTVPSLSPFLASNTDCDESDQARDVDRRLRAERRELLGNSDPGDPGAGDLLRSVEELERDLFALRMEVEFVAMKRARVVVTTSLSAQQRRVSTLLRGGHFDLVCLDEAGFSTDGDVASMFSEARKVVLSGDPLQLPPVVVSDQAKKEGYDISVLERLSGALPERVNLLTTQYRSNSLIAGWSSNYFYQGKVASHPSVGKMLLRELPGVSQEDLLVTRSPVLFVDTRGRNYSEEADPYSSSGADESIANYSEAFLVEELVNRLLSLGVPPSAIGVITPYWAQVATLRSLLWAEDGRARGMEVRTVDGFQGRQKEVIVLSMVRSNQAREVGFLEDTRRINVSITRAKKACFIVGDSETLNSDQGLRSFIGYCKAIGALVPITAVLPQYPT